MSAPELPEWMRKHQPKSVVYIKNLERERLWCSLTVREVLQRRREARETGELVDLDWVLSGVSTNPIFVHPDDIRNVEEYK